MLSYDLIVFITYQCLQGKFGACLGSIEVIVDSFMKYEQTFFSVCIKTIILNYYASVKS